MHLHWFKNCSTCFFGFRSQQSLFFPAILAFIFFVNKWLRLIVQKAERQKNDHVYNLYNEPCPKDSKLFFFST